MKYVELTETILKMLVNDVDALSIKEYETVEEDTIKIEILVSESDLGRVIGKNGKTINSIRNIVRTASIINDNKKIEINVSSY